LIFNLDRINGSNLPWFDKNTDHEEKSLALGFHHKSNKYTVFLDILLKDRQVTLSEIKFWGIWLDLNLNWDFHMENLIVKLSKFCFAIICKQKYCKNDVFRIFTSIFLIWYFILLKLETIKKILNYKKKKKKKGSKVKS
jgi:hypothetical protein